MNLQPGEPRISIVPAGTKRVLATALAAVCVLGNAATIVRADQVETDNGDRYVGKVLSLNADTLTLRNEVLGIVHVPRPRITVIALGTNTLKRAVTAEPSAPILHAMPVPSPTREPQDLTTMLRQLGSDTNAIRKVQEQFLAGAGPEANNKFNEMLGSLMSGRMTITDLQKEARSAADQLRALKKDIGPEAGDALEGYLSILDSFVAEVDASKQPATNAPVAGRGP